MKNKSTHVQTIACHQVLDNRWAQVLLGLLAKRSLLFFGSQCLRAKRRHATRRVVFVGGGEPGAEELPPSLDLIFPPTGLSENLGEWKGGGEGKGRVGETTCLTSPHWLLPQIPPSTRSCL